MDLSINKWSVEIGALGAAKTYERTYSEAVPKNVVESYESDNQRQMVKSKMQDSYSKSHFDHDAFLTALQYESYVNATLIEKESEDSKNESK